MFEVLVTTFVTAFTAITLYGHVLLAEALFTPDPAG